MAPTKCVGLGLLGQGQAPGGESVSGRFALATGFQLLQPILAHRLQHAEARLALDSLLLAQQTLVDQRGHAGEDIERPIRTRHRLRRLDRAAAGKDRQPAEEDLLLRGEQIVAPGDGIAHRLLACRQGAGAARQERQALLQPLQQGLRREDFDPRGGQLDGQRQPVEPGADLGHARERWRWSRRSPA